MSRNGSSRAGGTVGIPDKPILFLPSDLLYCTIAPLIVIGLGLLAVNQHPQPVDDCPCFEDAIAFVSVMVGLLLSVSVQVNFPAFSSPTAFTASQELLLPANFPGSHTTVTAVGLLSYLFISTLKLVIGTFIIFAFRLIAKPTLHAILPPTIRFVARLVSTIGWGLPHRRYYTPATEYGRMPFSVSEGGDGRGVEGSGLGELRTVPSMVDLSLELNGAGWEEFEGGSGVASGQKVVVGGEKMTRRSNTTTTTTTTPAAPEKTGTGEVGEFEIEGEARRREVVKHYDAIVLTKFVVYVGIGFISSAVCPVLFEAIGWAVVPRVG